MVTFTATEHDTVQEALQHLDAAGHDRVFTVGGQTFSCRLAEFERLQAAGIQPTRWHDRDGQIISVPGRD